MDAMNRALRRAAWLPFSDDIERAPRLSRFTWPPFYSYDGKTDLVEHISHYIHMMSLHTHNIALMCKVFPSSLGPTALRWFNGLRKGFHSQFCRANPGIRCSVHNVQSGVATSGCVALYEDEGRRNPSQLCLSVLEAVRF